MFKRKLLKRALPIILSVAMAFETMPVTAFAAEYGEIGTVEEAVSEESGTDGKNAGADSAASGDGEVQTEGGAEDAAEESGMPQETEPADAGASETGTGAGSEAGPAGTGTSESGPESGSEKGPAGAGTSETGTEADSETGQAGAGTSESETETGIGTETEAEEGAAAEGETQSQPEDALTAKIVVDDKKVDAYAMKDNGFTRILNEDGLVFFTEYIDKSKCGEFQDAIKDWLAVEVGGEKIDTLKDRLTYTWVKKDESGGMADTPLVNAVPGDAGQYELTVSMDLTNLDKLCNKLESDIKLSLTIEKADIELAFNCTTAPGKTAGELIDEINESYTIKYKNRDYHVSRDILAIKAADGKDDPDKKLPIHISVIDDNGTRQPMGETDRFDRTRDYVLTMDNIVLTENAAKNYELSVEDSYAVTVGQRQKTEVKFERKAPGEDLVGTYDPAKKWTIAEVTEGLFAEDVTDAAGAVTKAGAPAVYIHGKDDAEGECSVLLEEAEAEPQWYTRIRLIDGKTYTPDEEAGEIKAVDAGITYVYQPMTEDPGDAGEYYIIWSYAGDAGAYEKSHSEALRFTVDPAPVVVKTSQESVEQAGFRDGMEEEDVRKALAKLSYGVYPIVKDEITGVIEISGTALETSPDFFGTSYRGDVEDMATQYYAPEFVLQRRVAKLTEKGEASAAVDPRAVEWKTTESIRHIVDSKTDKIEFENIGQTELPNDVSKENLESVEFDFRIFFTGRKVIYDKDGNKVSIYNDTKKEYETVSVPITDVTTNAANRNYLADITKKTLEDTAVPVSIEEAERVQIVTDDIVEAFITDNGDMLYPQPADGEEAENDRQGTLERPAAKIYDKNPLFKDRASYKKALVHSYSEDGGIGGALSFSSTDEAFQYTWSYLTFDEYEKYLETWDEEQRKYKDFNDYYTDTNLGWGWTDVADGTLSSFRSAGLYRLTVAFDDPDHEYQSARAEVFFKVERQEVVIVPAKQYVTNKDSMESFLERMKGRTENRKDFTIYKLPHNSMEEYNALTDEAREDYALPTEDEIAEFETKHGRKPDMNLNLTWEVMRKEKDPATGLDKESWIQAEGDFDDDFTYGVVAHWTGNLPEPEPEPEPGPEDKKIEDNYTTKDVMTYRKTGEEKHHESVGAVSVCNKQIYVEADLEKVKALGHVYDGEPVSLEEAAKALSFYTDETLSDAGRLPTEDVVNTAEEYDQTKINIYWQKTENKEIYANKNAVYGGTYRLALRFEGGQLDTAGAQNDAEYAPLKPAKNDAVSREGWWSDPECTFTIRPCEITIAPKPLPAGILKAGEKADTLLAEGIDVQGVLEKDQEFFEYAQTAAGSFDVTWDGRNADGTDKEGFAYKYNIDKNGGYPAFNGAAKYVVQVDGREIKDPANEYLRFGSTYTVKLTNNLVSPLGESYRVTYRTDEITVEKRGNADVAGIVDNNNQLSDLSAHGVVYDFDGGTYIVKPRGAVRFYSNNVFVTGREGQEPLINTNVLGFRIYAPKEYLNDFETDKKNFVYKNAVWNAGGYFLGDTDWQAGAFEGEQRRYIDVVFPLTKEDMERSFQITWEDGYTETFTLADVVLEEDLTKAVAPKSIAFNGVAGKMAVGEKQQLNLKLTKAQLGDVISIRYRIKGGGTKNEYISLDPETGVVTALKAGKTATAVEAYPVYQDAEGNFVPVLDSRGKEAKAASAKITVTEVTASTVKNIIAQGDSIKLYFTVPDDGYRREIYVTDVTKGTEYEARKKWKPADFNEAIAGMINGGWENAGFAVPPVYSYAKNEDLDIKEANGTYDKKLKAHITTIGHLEAEHEYAVYVRNVSASRALDDGSVVALSANGAVKSFKTTKPQVQQLQLGFTVKTDENDRKNTVTHPVNKDGTVAVDKYTVELSAKKAQLNVYGLFSDKAGGNEAAEDTDLRRYSLVPTLKEEKDALKKYQMPKLEYVIYDEKPEEAFAPGLEQSKYATVSNKGLVSLKGVDLNGEKTVYIYVRDSIQHQDDFWDDAWVELTITAKPASVAGKKAKLTVGQTGKLSDYLEYKDAKKKKIPGYRSSGVTITREMLAEAEEAGYRIEDRGKDKLTHDWYITAVSPSKGIFDLKVKDFDAEGNPMETVVKLTSAAINPVKGLKVTYVDDQNITITFTHPSNLDENDTGTVYDYALEIKDARGNVVDKIVLSNPDKVSDIDGVDSKELKRVQSWFQHKGTKVVNTTPKNKTISVDTNQNLGFNYYTGTKTKTKTFAYTYPNKNRYRNPEQIPNLKLIRLSSYTISVTPLFENQKADKAATVKAKTTNIPACPDDIDITGKGPDKLGGNLLIGITSSGSQSSVKGGAAGAAQNITEPYRLISGNTYTLQFTPLDAAARDRVTDALTWKSSNTKVASVKANAGTYTATFKALNQGRTIISVTSKITKRVIARYAVMVYAVKDGSSYGGDFEPTWQNGFYENILALYDPFYEGRLEVLSMNEPLVLNNKDAEGNVNPNVRTWVSFTAPHYGQYTFSRTDNFYDSRDGKLIGGNTNTLFLEANQKVYFRVEGNATLSVTGTELARLLKTHTKDAPLEVKAGYVSFTAWEDNVYTFWHNGTEFIVDGKKETGIKAGETKFLDVTSDGKMYVTWREEAAAEELKLGSHPTGTVTLDKDNQVRYISFTANVAGEYAFQYTKADGVTVAFSTAAGGTCSPVYKDEKDTEKDAAKEIAEHFFLEEGEKIVIGFKAVPEITDAAKKFSVSVTVTAPQRRKIEGTTITIPKGTTEIVEYVIPSFTTEKAKFTFKAEGKDGTHIERYFNKDYNTIVLNGNTNNALVLAKNSDIKAGDSIYIMVQAGGQADDKEAKDAVLTVTQVPVDTLTAGLEKKREIDNNTEQWYTFTAPGDGYYEFGVTVAERAQGDKTPTHSASLAFYSELFGELKPSNITKILFMKTGETAAVELKPGYVKDIVKEGATKEDGTKEESTTEIVKSNAAVSVKALDIQPLVLDVESEPIPIPAKSKEARYYSFTATAGADYTIVWKPADAKTDNAKVTYFSEITSQSGSQTVAANGSSIKLKNGEVRYIKVELDDAESGNAVSGTLCVTAANLNADALTVGIPYPFHLEDKDGKGGQKVVKFTAPEPGNYAIDTMVEENPVNGLPYEYPAIHVDGTDTPIGTPFGFVLFEKGETKYFILSFQTDGEVKETKGTVTIRSLAEPFEGEQVDVSVAKGNVREFTYTIPVSGRYEFKADYDEKKADVEWTYYDTDQEGSGKLADGNYCQKNTKVKVTVKGLDEDADASVKLYKPAIITITPLNAGANSIEVNAGETKYYELSVGGEPKIYEFELSDITGTATVVMRYAKDNDNFDEKHRLSDGGAVSMQKDSRLLIQIQSGSEKKGVNCKLNVTERRELALGGNPVHLDAGESVSLTYRAPETGYYSFQVNQPGAALVLQTGSRTKIGDSFYDIANLTAKGTRTYKLTNEGSGAADITVTMRAENPIALSPGGKAEAVTIPADGKAYFALKTFKKAAYIIKIADTSKGADLSVKLTCENKDVTYEKKKTEDGISLEAQLNSETILCVTNNGVKETAVTAELALSEAQPLPNEPVTLAKNESRLISFVAAEDTRYLISKDNEDVKMTLVSEQKLSDGTTEYPSEPVPAKGYAEKMLHKGDKLVYKLSYEPEAADKKAKESQTVNVKIVKIEPAAIGAEATPVTIGEKDYSSVWYQFTAAKDAIHTFTLEDAYGNEVPNRMTFYRYFTDTTGEPGAERHMKAGRKVYIHVDYPDAGSYTLKYKAVEALTETGAKTLDFEYQGEVQEVKFVVPKGGIYKVSATAVRGGFTVTGKIGSQPVVTQFNTNGGQTSTFLKKDDIVTFTVKAAQGGKSSVTLRIAEDNIAETLTLGKEYAGVSDTEKEVYHEIRIEKDGWYAIAAGGAPTAMYAVNNDSFKNMGGIAYEDLDKDDRVVIKMEATTSEKAYTVKVEEISAVSLDGKNKEEEPYSVNADENYYGFTTEKAYVRFKVPEDGNYYIAVQTVNDNTRYNGMTVANPTTAAEAALVQAGIKALKKDQTVTFTFTNSEPKNEEDPAQKYKEALFKLTVGKAAADENPIQAGETKSDSLAAGEMVSYQFKVAEAGKYIISFNGSNCTLSGASDGEEKTLAEDQVLILTVSNMSGTKAGSYELTVTKLSPEKLTLGNAAEKTLKKGETAYYEFDSTETTDDGETAYQVYLGVSTYGGYVGYMCSKADTEGKEVLMYNGGGNCNREYPLKKGEKLAFRVTNNSDGNTAFKLTVKKVEYKPIKADTPDLGTLDAYENAYYEFISEDASADETAYQVSLADSDSVKIQKIQTAKWEKDSDGNNMLGMPVDVTGQKTVTLKKGEKLLIIAANAGTKAAQFELAVEKVEETAVSYEPIALDEKKTGKLAEDEKAGYEFTASDTAEEGTLYSVYFDGETSNTTCSCVQTAAVTGDDGKATESTTPVILHTGSREFTWKNGDKIRFTVSGAGKYELTVRKVTYVPLTLGTAAAKTLYHGETAYYQYTSQEDPAAGETTTKYQVYGSFNDYAVQTRTVTIGEDGKAAETDWTDRSLEYDLEKGQILQFKVTGNNSSDASQFRLAIKKVEYSQMTSGTAVEGRLDYAEDGYAYYEFISQDTPAEGQTKTTYQVYGTAYYYYSIVTVNEDKTLTSLGEYYQSKAMKIPLAKGERLRFRVYSSSNTKEGYDLAVAKTEERAIIVGSETETGSLGRGQELVYTLAYEKDTPTTYTLSYEPAENVNISVSGAIMKDGMQRIQVSKGDTLKVTVTAKEETDNFAFTVSEFKPEMLSLGTMTGLKKLALSESVYYQYKAGTEGSYVLSMIESESGRLTLQYEVNRADVAEKNGLVSSGVGEIELQKDDILLVKVTAPGKKAVAAYSCRLLLQKKTAEESMTALPWNGTMQPGEVKYFKFTLPEPEKEEEPADPKKYAYSIMYTSGRMKFTCNGVSIDTELNDVYSEETDKGFVLRAANISMYSAADLSIDVQESPYLEWSGNGITLAKGETAYYKYTPVTPVSAGDYVLEYEEGIHIQYSTDRTATKSWVNTSGPGKHTITVPDDNGQIFLKISHDGEGEQSIFKVTIKEAEYAGFHLRASREKVLIGSGTLYLYLDTDVKTDKITVSCKDGGNEELNQIDLYDDGSSAHGDDIKGDGTYSAIISDVPSEETELSFTANYNKKKSNKVTVSFYTPLPDDVYGIMDTASDEIETLLNDADFTGKTDEEKLEMTSELLEKLVDNNLIMENSIQIDKENTMVSFQYPEGVLGGIMYGEFGEDFNGAVTPDAAYGTGEEKERKASYPERNTYVPAVLNDVADTEQSQEIGRAVILNSFPSFETTPSMIEYRSGFYESLKSKWEEAGLKTVLDTDVTVDDYKNLHNYNVVCISTHGSMYGYTNPAICLSQKQSAADSKKYEAELKNQQLAVVNGSYWILPSFFTAQYGDDALEDTFVFSECCMALGTGQGSNTSNYTYTMADAFTDSGAKAYIGFHNSVFADYSREFMEEYVMRLMEGATSQKAFESAVDKYGADHEEWYNRVSSGTLEDYYKKYKGAYIPSVHIAYPVRSGDENAVLINNGLLNGDFEAYNSSTTAPRSWACMGDVRTLAQLGDVMPYGDESRRMAIITTGIGAKESAEFEGGTEGSMLSQTFHVPDGVSKICFDYNFISEEPMEYVGSQFDDNFGVQIANGGNTVLKETFESINTSEWKEVEGINFAGGDDTVFHTEWKTAEVDVSAYRGSVITLSFIIYDVGDQIYDSACVIDNVMLQ